MPFPPPQAVPGISTRSKAVATGLAAPSSSYRSSNTPSSEEAMAGISFTNGGGFSFEDRPRSAKWGNESGSYGARFYGDGMDSPHVLSTSITMEPSSFVTSANAFNLPSSSMSSSFQRRSYAAAVAGRETGLSTSFASMSFHPMSLGTLYSKSRVTNLLANQDDMTKGYQCCGLTHEGLHALLEHVEDAHPSSDPDLPSDSGFSPMTHAMDLELEELDSAPRLEEQVRSSRSSLSPVIPNYPLPTSAASSKPPTPNEQCFAPLSISDVLTSPPDELPHALSASSSPPETLATPTTSSQVSPIFLTPKLNPARGVFLGANAPRAPIQQRRFNCAFNDVVVEKTGLLHEDRAPALTAIAPGALFASAVTGLGIPTTRDYDADRTQETDKTLELPQPSLFTNHKPWRCPNPGCHKAYRQSNGLKYHQQKGQCDFAIVDAVDLGVSVEQAEQRSRPFVCAVKAGCTKRYRQMNGLKYHYLNSGEHGQYGLRMLQNGTHPQPSNTPPTQQKRPPPPTTHVTPARSTGTAPYNIPNRQRMATWPIKHVAPKVTIQHMPVQRGRDAVLFAANDPMDVMGRMDA